MRRPLLGLESTAQGRIHGDTGPTGKLIDHPDLELLQVLKSKEREQKKKKAIIK